MTKSLFDCVRTSERPLHGHLLIEQHANEQRRAVAVEQCVGLWDARDVEGASDGERDRDKERGIDCVCEWKK